MTHIFRLARRVTRFRAPLLVSLLALAFGACDDPTDPFTSDADITDAELVPGDAELVPADAEFSAGRFAGGIPFGTFAQPSNTFGTHYNGGLRNIYPQFLLQHLKDIKARGGKVVLNLAGGQDRYRDSRNNFSLSKWKASVDRFRNLNINSYINDGTIIAHFLMDEPHNKSRWNGKTVSPAMIEEMAKYSKARWPGMATTIRAYPNWLVKYNGNYRYLDAAWVQYAARFGDAGSYMRKEIAYAQKKGLGLIVGLNILKGGPNKKKLTASQVKSYGSALLASSYPCAFISWKHDSRYLSSGSIKDAMKSLRNKAQNRSSKSCRSGGKQSRPPESSPSEGGGSGGSSGGSPSAGAPSSGGSSSITARVSGRVEKKRHHLTLTWSGIKGSTVDVHRNYRSRILRTPNDGRLQNWVPFRGRASYTFKVCQKGTSKCSKSVRVAFK